MAMAGSFSKIMNICVMLLVVAASTIDVFAFTLQPPIHPRRKAIALVNRDNYVASKSRRTITRLCTSMSRTNSDNSLHKVPEDDDTAIPFVEVDNSSFIECYADSIAIVDGVEYTIGSPCDNAVALCYFDSDEQLIPIEMDEDLMDEIFALAAR